MILIPRRVSLNLDDLPARAVQVYQETRLILGGKCVNIAPAPIWNQRDANSKCEKICRWNGGRWNGQWKTIVPNKASACTCCR